jgi:peptide/nickel transport system permease protein
LTDSQGTKQGVLGALPISATTSTEQNGDWRELSRKPRSLTSDALRRMARSPSGIIGVISLSILVFIALTAAWIAPFDPFAVDPVNAFQAPSLHHLMGTDQFGRDVFSRVLHGTKLSLLIGLVATTVAFSLGVVVGLFSGYAGATADLVVMRVVDIMIAIPSQLMALTIVAVMGPSLRNVMLATGISAVPRFSRLVRSSVLSAKQNDYVLAARTVGCADYRIAIRHILPNAIGPALILAAIYVSWAILLTAGLSFLGMGAQPPAPEWGLMLSNGRQYLRAAPWLTAFPGFAIMLTVVAINLLGDALRDAFDPRLTA